MSPTKIGAPGGGRMNDIPTYLDQRLPSIAAGGLKAVHTAINRVMSVASGRGRLGSSGIWFQYDDAIEQEFRNAVNEAASLIAKIAGPAAPSYAEHLEKFASGLGDQIIQSREQRRNAGSAYSERELLNAHINRLREVLARARENIVGDFRFGVVEGKQMASGPVQNVVTIQNVSDSIINVVQAGHLSGNYQELGRRLADTLKSPEIEQLPPEEKQEVADLADIVKDELANASPEQGKVRRGLALLGRALGRFGANTASATIGKLIADYLSPG
jgi:hypothetical protein